MAGGTWDFQNKIEPGFYLNFKSSPASLVTVGDRGVVAIARELDWGDPTEIIRIASTSDAFTKLGYDITDPKMKFLQQIFRGTNRTSGASQVLVGRLATTGGAAATATIGELTVTAKYQGVRGNDVTMVIAPDLDTEITTDVYAVFRVETVVDGLIQDTQTVGSFTSTSVNVPAKVGDLVNNEWVNFTGTAESPLTQTAGTPLTGGTNGTIAAPAHSTFLSALENYNFTVVCYDGVDQVTKTAYLNFVTRRGYGEGFYSQLVVSDYHTADEILCISVDNGIVLNTDAEDITPADALQTAVWWFAGATAGATVSQTLTYASHPDGIGVLPVLDTLTRETAILQGSVVFFVEFDIVKILTDINTFTTYRTDRGPVYAKNRTIRVVTSIANDIYRVFATYYIGQVDNTPTGRNLFKAEIIRYVMQLQGNGAVVNFVADDVEVLPGIAVDAIVVNLAIQVAQAVEKIYMTVTVTAEDTAA